MCIAIRGYVLYYLYSLKPQLHQYSKCGNSRNVSLGIKIQYFLHVAASASLQCCGLWREGGRVGRGKGLLRDGEREREGEIWVGERAMALAGRTSIGFGNNNVSLPACLRVSESGPPYTYGQFISNKSKHTIVY